jgi:hypothetical protein
MGIYFFFYCVSGIIFPLFCFVFWEHEGGCHTFKKSKNIYLNILYINIKPGNVPFWPKRVARRKTTVFGRKCVVEVDSVHIPLIRSVTA